MDRRRLQRPPAMGDSKRAADADAPVLRAQLRTVMRLDNLSVEAVAAAATVDVAALQTFLEGASLSPRWQARLARWLEAAIEPKTPN